MPDPILDRDSLESAFNQFNDRSVNQAEIPNVAFQEPVRPNVLGSNNLSPLQQWESDSHKGESFMQGSRSMSISNLKNDKYASYDPSPGIDNEDVAARGQSTWDKAANGLIKMGGTAINTAVSSTLGTLNGIGKWIETGKFSSFYDNELSHQLDDQMKSMEEMFPHYKTAQQRSEDWYQPANLFSANFVWDSVVKNLGFSLGAAIPALGVGKALNALKLSSKLFALGEGLAATEVIEGATQLPRIQQLAAMESKLQTIINTGKSITGKALKGLGSESGQGGHLVQGIASVLSSSGEASMEAYNNLNQFRNDRIKEYKDGYTDRKGNKIEGHGVAPTGQDLQDINDNAENVGNSSYGLNVLLLSGTEYVQLPKIFGSTFKGEKNLLNRTIQNPKTGLWESALPTKGFAKFATKAKNIASLGFNEAEAFEEGAQYAIQTGTQDYYDKKYRKQGGDILSSIGYGIGQAVGTSEGLENIFLGGFSGALMTSGFVGRNSEGKFGLGVSGKIGERGLTGYGGEREKNTAEYVKGVNDPKFSFTNYLKDGVDQANRATTIQEQRESAIRQGNILESKDLEFDYSHNYLSHRIKWGRFDLVESDIKEAKENAAIPEGFSQLQQSGKASEFDTPLTFLARLNNFEEHAKSVKNQYEQLNTKYGGLIDKEGNKVYPQEVLDKLVYAASKVEDYDKRLPTLTRDLLAKGIQVSAVLGESLGITKEEGVSHEKEAFAAIEKLDEIGEVKEDLKQKLQDTIELTHRRRDFINEYNDIKKSPLNHVEKETKLSTEPVNVTTKSGAKNLEVGQEYFLSSIESQTKQGLVSKKYPTFTVISQEDNGDLTVKDRSGVVKVIPKAELAKYDIGKMSDLEKNPKALFYYKNRASIFKYKFKSGKKSGILRYSHKQDELLFEYVDAKGKIRTVPVKNKNFSYELAKKAGYKEPLITKTKEKLQDVPQGEDVSDEEYKAETENISKIKDNVVNKFTHRFNMLAALVSDTKASLEANKKELESKKEQLKDLEESFKNLKIVSEETTSKGNLKKVAKNALKTLKVLGETKISLLENIRDLEAQQEELSIALPYFEEVYENVDQLPDNLRHAIPQLNKEIDTLKELIDHTTEAITNSHSLIDKVSDILNDAYNILKGYIKRLKEENTFIDVDTYQDKLEKYLGEEGAKQFIENKGGFTEAIKGIQADILDFEGELQISINEKKLKDLQDNLAELHKGVDKLINGQIARSNLIDFLEEKISDFEKEQADKKEKLTDKVVQDKYFAQQKAVQQITGVPTEPIGDFPDDFKKEMAKKGLDVAWVSSTDPEWNEVTKDNFHQRHQTFLFNSTSTDPNIFSQEEFQGVKAKDRLRIIPLSSNNAEELGFDKDWIEEENRFNGTNADDAAIRYVYTILEGTKLYYVDEKGNKMEEVKPASERETKTTPDLKEKREEEIEALDNPKLGLDFLKEDQLPQEKVSAVNKKGKAIGNKFVAKEESVLKQNEIKEKLDNLKKLLECL